MNNTPDFYFPGAEREVWVDTPDDAPPTDSAYEWKTRKLCTCGPVVPLSELARYVSSIGFCSHDDEWGDTCPDCIAEALAGRFDIRPKPEGETP